MLASTFALQVLLSPCLVPSRLLQFLSFLQGYRIHLFHIVQIFLIASLSGWCETFPMSPLQDHITSPRTYTLHLLLHAYRRHVLGMGYGLYVRKYGNVFQEIFCLLQGSIFFALTFSVWHSFLVRHTNCCTVIVSSFLLTKICRFILVFTSRTKGKRSPATGRAFLVAMNPALNFATHRVGRKQLEHFLFASPKSIGFTVLKRLCFFWLRTFAGTTFAEWKHLTRRYVRSTK